MSDQLENDFGVNEAQPEAEPEAPPAETGEQEAKPEGEQPAQEAAPEDPIDRRLKGLESAIAEERSKRQAAEHELSYIRGQFDARKPQQQEQPEVDWSEEDKRFWENPAKYTHEVTMTKAEQIAASRLAERDKMVLAASANRVYQQHEDYLEKEQVFLQAASQNKALWSQILAHPEPAQAMYDMVTRYQQQQAVGPDWEAKKEAEIRARIEAEMKQERAKRAVAGAPMTQAGARGSGVAQASVSGDPFDEIQRY